MPAGPINNAGEALDHPHSKARNVVWTFDDEGEPLHVLANPLQHMSRTPPKPTSGAPRLGADTLSILMSQAGLTKEDIEILIARDKVIGVGQAGTEDSQGRRMMFLSAARLARTLKCQAGTSVGVIR